MSSRSLHTAVALSLASLMLVGCCCPRPPRCCPSPTAATPSQDVSAADRAAKTWWISCRIDDCGCKVFAEPVVIVGGDKPINYCCARGFASEGDATKFLKSILLDFPGNTDCVDKKKCPGCP